MTTRRMAKASRAIREAVSTGILFELRDPRVKDVTVLDVAVAPDLRSAKVYVSVMGDESTQKLCLKGLESSRGFLQSMVAERVNTRYIPILKFVLDDGVKRSVETSKILQELEMSEDSTEPHPPQESD